MILCPWCGTHYQAFQSNCKNCGGPIPMPAENTQKGGNSDLIPPPPAPRPISNQYIWKLLVSDGWALAGMIIAPIGAIFLIVGAGLTLGVVTALVGIPFVLLGVLLLAAGGALVGWRYQEKHKVVQVLQNGLTTRGAILSVEENLAVMVNNRHPWRIDYQFTVNGQSWEGKVTTLNRPAPFLRAGEAAYVLYMPEAPQYNSLYPHP